MKIGLFYGSSTCYTEMAAEKIREILGEDLVDLHNLKDVPHTDGSVFHPDPRDTNLGLR